jgi:hypothetical protein
MPWNLTVGTEENLSQDSRCPGRDSNRVLSAVGIVTGYGLEDRGGGVRVPVESRIFSSPQRPERLWGPPSLSNGYPGLFPRGGVNSPIRLRGKHLIS